MIFVKLAFSILVMMLAAKLCSHNMTKDAVRLCQNIANDSSVREVRLIADDHGYRHFSSIRGNMIKITIPTQDSPLFRFACVATFDNGKLIRKEVRADD